MPWFGNQIVIEETKVDILSFYLSKNGVIFVRERTPIRGGRQQPFQSLREFK